LCDYFGVSLDYLINGEVTTITPHEKKVIESYRKNKDMRIAVDRILGIEVESAFNTIADDIIKTVLGTVSHTVTK